MSNLDTTTLGIHTYANMVLKFQKRAIFEPDQGVVWMLKLVCLFVCLFMMNCLAAHLLECILLETHDELFRGSSTVVYYCLTMRYHICRNPWSHEPDLSSQAGFCRTRLNAKTYGKWKFKKSEKLDDVPNESDQELLKLSQNKKNWGFVEVLMKR